MAVMGSEVEFKSYEQQQGELLPAFVGDALDPTDPVFFVDDVVEDLDLESFERRYAAVGEHAFPPRMLLKLWLFGAIAGVHSGREIGRIQSTDVVLPLADEPRRELRIRCVVRPDKAQAMLLDRLGLRLPERLRLPPTCRRNVVPTRDPKCLKNLETDL